MSDFRMAVRSLRATPIVTVVAILSLALGIGANTAIFTLVDSLLLRALPVREPARLVLVSDASARNTQSWSYPAWQQIEQRPELFESAAAWNFVRFNLADAGETDWADGAWASGSYFDTLGVRAALGRTFSAIDDRHAAGDGPVVVISDGFWQRRFGRAPDVIGRRILLNGVAASIIGVTPPDFFGVDVGRRCDLVLPLQDEPLVNGRDSALHTASMVVRIFARLKPGQTLEAATAALRAAQPAIRHALVPSDVGKGDPFLRDYLQSPFTLVPAANGHSDFRRRYAQPLVLILGAAALVLLVACANVAHLLLARAAARRHELSVRVALGASRWRLARLLLVESVLLAVVSAGLGIVIASWASRLLVQQLSTPTGPVFLDLSADWRIVTFAATAAASTLLLFGVLPALRASAADPIDAIKEHARGSHGGSSGSLGGALMVGQVALSLIVVTLGALFAQTFASLVRRDPGFARDVLVVRVDSARAIADPRQRMPTYERVRQAVRAVPGVADAGVSYLSPVSNLVFDPPIDVSGTGPLTLRERTVYGNVISPGWFSTFGIVVNSGRDLSDSDRVGTPPVAIVNHAFARKFFN